jgi:hypothetical protein
LRGNERPTLTFNKPVVPLGAAEEEMPVPATLTPAVAGEWRWIGSSAVEFMPKAPLPYATSFTVTVKPELAALDGEKMAAPFSFSFASLAPEFSGSSPTLGSPWLDPKEPLTLTFNQPVKNLEKAKMTVGGAAVNLSPLEFRLLSYLMHNAGRVVSQIELGEQIHGDHSERGSNAIEVIVGRIRRKLGIAFIETRRGFGYVVGGTDA